MSPRCQSLALFFLLTLSPLLPSLLALPSLLQIADVPLLLPLSEEQQGTTTAASVPVVGALAAAFHLSKAKYQIADVPLLLSSSEKQ